MINIVVVSGRLTHDIELKMTPSQVEMVQFSLACDRNFKNKTTGEKETDFIDCVAWRGQASVLGKYATKGMLLQVQGRLQVENWTDKEGKARKAVKIQVVDLQLPPKSSNMWESTTPAPPTPKATIPTPNTAYQELLGEDEELPF